MNLYDRGTLDRRKWFGLAFGSLATSSILQHQAIADDLGKLIVRGGEPLNAETPVSAFTTYLTPNRQFFVRSHFGAPAVGLRPWRVELHGRDDKHLSLSLDDLKGLEQVTLPAVLQCSGNGRGLYSPTIPGVGWERGAVGNAEWSGVRLIDLLKKVGIDDAKHRHVHFQGADLPPNPKTPAFYRSLPIERALHPSTVVALRMNGEDLPALHGGPIRLVVPGWSGNHWIKWLRTIRLATEDFPGFFQRTGYRMPKDPAQPPATVKPEDTVPVTTLNVKSLIATPTVGQSLKAGKNEIGGVAWTGEGRIARVEVAIDDQPWALASLNGPDHEGSWRLWTFEWTATPGKHTVRARATDTKGDVQPVTSPWNKSGYLWNGIESVAFEVQNA